MMSTAQREIHEERERVRAEASRAGRVAARMERVAVEVELAEAGPVFSLDSTERDAELLAGLISGTSPRHLVADDE